MPNIFPPIDTQNPQVAQGVEEGTPVPQSAILGTVAAPSRAKLAYDTANRGVEAAQAQLAADTPKKYDYSAHSVLGNVGHVLGRFGNIAGDILDPEATSLIPGTDLYNGRRLAQDQEGVDKAQVNAESAGRQSDAVDNEQANRDLTQQGQDDDRKRYDEGADQRNATLRNTQLSGDQTEQNINNNKPLDDAGVNGLNDIYASVLKSAGIKAPMFRAGMSPAEVQRSIQSLEHIADQTQKDREFKLAQSGLSLQRQVANQNHQDGVDQREGDTGRKILDKSEDTYRKATGAADQMDQFIELAKSGNKAAGQMVPLEGALEITSASGVHRINRTEVDQYAGAGSLYDKVHGELSKLTTGQPIPTNVLSDMRQLSDVLRQGAYKNYKGSYDSTTKRYKLPNEQPLPSPGIGGGQQQRVTATGPGGHQIVSNDGGNSWADAKTGAPVR